MLENSLLSVKEFCDKKIYFLEFVQRKKAIENKNCFAVVKTIHVISRTIQKTAHQSVIVTSKELYLSLPASTSVNVLVQLIQGSS
jgi:hypothetical protein